MVRPPLSPLPVHHPFRRYRPAYHVQLRARRYVHHSAQGDRSFRQDCGRGHRRLARGESAICCLGCRCWSPRRCCCWRRGSGNDPRALRGLCVACRNHKPVLQRVMVTTQQRYSSAPNRTVRSATRQDAGRKRIRRAPQLASRLLQVISSNLSAGGTWL